jgi:putative DNA primase/helicase
MKKYKRFLLSNIKSKNKYSELLKILDKNLSKAGSVKFSKDVFDQLKEDFYMPDLLSNINSISHMLPIKNGQVINLITGEVRDRQRDDYFSCECPVTYKEKYDRKFVNSLIGNMCEDENAFNFLQELLGALLTGENFRHFIIVLGNGRNGKTLLFNVILKAILGPLWGRLSSDVVIKTNSHHKGGASEYLLKMRGLRVGVISEAEDRTLDTEQIKSITGEDIIHARGLYERQSVEFVNQCRIVLITNDLPNFKLSDYAFIDRMIVLKFPFRFVDNPGNNVDEKKADDSLIKKGLTEKLDDIFSWMVQGAIKFYKQGLNLSLVGKYRNEYITEIDNVTPFIKGNYEKTNNYADKIKSTQLYSDYRDYCENNLYEPVNRNVFYKICSSIFDKKVFISGCQYYRNIKKIVQPLTKKNIEEMHEEIQDELD